MERTESCGNLNLRIGCAGAIKSSLRVLEGKWKIIIINELMSNKTGPLRFSELERQVQGVTQKVLIQQLKELEKDGVVLRKLYPQVPPKVEYSLTDLGLKLRPAMQALIEWAETRATIQDQDTADAQHI